MSKPFDDPYPTISMRVPNLVELLTRLRDDSIAHGITVVHAEREGEGDWVLANAAARLARSNVKVVGPEPIKAVDLVEHAVRIGAKLVFIGEIRREEDARAARAAAALRIKPVGIITANKLSDAQALITVLGPWKGYDIALLSQQTSP
ncbi:MAG: hypothetical protein ACXWNK_16605 [Vulcanimicrobiaceae bacterium]